MARRLHALMARLPEGMRPASSAANQGDGASPPSAIHPPPSAVLRASPESPEPESDDGQAADRPARLDPGLSGARALAVVGVIAVLVAAGFLWVSRPRSAPAVRSETVPSLAGGPTPTSAAAAPIPATGVGGARGPGLVVHVSGKVRRPGVVSLPSGARVTDAISAAGGLRPGAGPGALNLARKVVDGEQIVVGSATPQPPVPPAGAGPPSGSQAGAPAAGAPLDLNAATLDSFQQLPGVGPVLAQRIVDYRTRHGAFRSVEELQEVSGIGAKRYAELKDLVRV